VSGRHFQIEMDAQQCFLQDLGGPNKPRIDGRPVSRWEIRDQAEVQVGTTRLRLELTRDSVGPRCYMCKRPIEGVSTVSAENLKETDAADRAVYAHSDHLTRDEHFGREFGEYLCYRRLGGGAFGEVFLAYETKTARVWAIKTALQSQGPDGLHRFRREARLLQTLRHPHIVYCIGSGVKTDGTAYLVSEFVTGGDLQTLIHEKGALPLDRASQLMAPLLGALVHLQAPPGQMMHRDIKPANVLLTPGTSGTLVPKLADFGLAKAFGVIATPVTQPGQILGTIPFMAPEIVNTGSSPGDPFQPGSDVYSLGATFYFMLTLRYPFDFPAQATATEILFHIAHPLNDTIPISSRGVSLSRQVAAVIDRACEKDPERRFPNAVEFRKEFLSALQA